MIPVYWINLSNSIDRRNKMISQFFDQGIPNRRIEAIHHEKPLIGCCYSHIKAIHTAWIEGNELAIICEDDVNFSNGSQIFTRINNVLTTLPESIKDDWDILQIQYTEPHFSKALHDYINRIRDNDKAIELENRVIKGYLYGAVAYLINRKGMDKFLKLMTINSSEDLSKYTIIATFDHPRAHSEELIYRYINSYMSVFPILNYMASDSLINSTHTYFIVNEINRTIANQIRNTLSDINYNIIKNKDIYVLDYNIHWFNEGQVQVENVINDIFK